MAFLIEPLIGDRPRFCLVLRGQAVGSQTIKGRNLQGSSYRGSRLAEVELLWVGTIGAQVIVGATWIRGKVALKEEKTTDWLVKNLLTYWELKKETHGRKVLIVVQSSRINLLLGPVVHGVIILHLQSTLRPVVCRVITLHLQSTLRPMMRRVMTLYLQSTLRPVIRKVMTLHLQSTSWPVVRRIIPFTIYIAEVEITPRRPHPTASNQVEFPCYYSPPVWRIFIAPSRPIDSN